MLKIVFLCALSILAVALTSVETSGNKLVLPKPPIRAVGIVEGEILNKDANEVQEISGLVSFEQISLYGPVRVHVEISGLLKTGKHGLHVHESGLRINTHNITARCGSAGPHFNPLNQQHGGRSSQVRHVGDLGNVESDANGVIYESFVDSEIQLWGSHSIIGRSIVLHEKEDDLGVNEDVGSKTIGNSGARLACGVIGYSN